MGIAGRRYYIASRPNHEHGNPAKRREFRDRRVWPRATKTNDGVGGETREQRFERPDAIRWEMRKVPFLAMRVDEFCEKGTVVIKADHHGSFLDEFHCSCA